MSEEGTGSHYAFAGNQTCVFSASLSLLISGFKRETENISPGYWKKDWLLGKADLG